jgi:integrase
MSVQQKKDGRFFCVYYDLGKQVWEAFGRGIEGRRAAEVRDLEVRLKKRKGTWAKRSTALPMKFCELAQQYISVRANALAERTVDEISRVVATYALPVFGQKYCNQVTMDDWWRIQDVMVARGAKNQTINKCFTYISGVFRWAVDENDGLLDEHPWGKRKRLKVTRRFSIELFSRDEFLAILRVAEPHLRWALEVAYYTGVRPGPSELFALQWTHVDWIRNRMRVYSPKTDHGRWLNLPAEFMKRLKAQYELAEGCLYIVSYHGRPVRSLKTAWHTALRRAKIRKHIRLYDIRHFYISYALARGADIMELAESVGHRNGEMIMRVYAHLAKDLNNNTPHQVPSLYEAETEFAD